MDMESGRIVIEGELSIATVADQVSAVRLRHFLDGVESGSFQGRPLVDLARVEDIDLSGWQLLAVWFRHARRLGFDPALVNVREELRRRLKILGLAREFAMADVPEDGA